MPYDEYKWREYNPFEEYESKLAQQRQAEEERRYGEFYEEDDGTLTRSGLKVFSPKALYHRDHPLADPSYDASEDARSAYPPYIPARRMRRVLEQTDPEGSRPVPGHGRPQHVNEGEWPGLEPIEMDILLERLQEYRMRTPGRPKAL